MPFHKAVMGTAVNAGRRLVCVLWPHSTDRIQEKTGAIRCIWDSKYPNVDVFLWLLLSDLKTAPVQGDDFSSGTSSRSTELIHGGVRYLQKAIMKLDYKQVNASFFLPPQMFDFPRYCEVDDSLTLKAQERRAVGVIVYYDAQRQHNDARMNLAIALTAARYGAAIANYTEVVHLLKRADPQTGKKRVCGAHCRDVITGQEFDVRAKCVINATGPFTDAPWKMDDQKHPDICQPGAGVHIVILGYYSTELQDPVVSSKVIAVEEDIKTSDWGPQLAQPGNRR
uniref:glycerol-3-phosphate dehydrogenase n=1 Tax=Stegastes partitus TaxID=144197 RepID=A0A3B4ZF41_9TELE